MERYIWSRLNKQQVGAFTEYFVKMELTMYEFQVYGTEIDDRGIYFIARYEYGPFIEVQVKPLRSYGYAFIPKDKFELHENRFLAFGFLIDTCPPQLYLVPSLAWKECNPIFVSHDYEGLKKQARVGNKPIEEEHEVDGAL